VKIAAFLDNFDLLADTPNAVASLRPLILHYAFRGLLTHRSAGDEPAEKLLARSRAAMAEQMAKGKAKREKPAAPVEETEQAFPPPEGWVWCRLVDTGQFINGLAFKPSHWGPAGRPIIRIQNLSGRNTEYNRTTGTFEPDVLVQDGDVLVSWSATLDAFIWRGEEGVLNQHIFRVLPSPLVDKRFIYWLLKWVIRQLAESDHAHGLVMTHINRGPFLAHPIPIPPLAEQKRIVAKVDELMALCDRLEAQQQQREHAHAALSQAALASFGEEPKAETFEYLFHESYTTPTGELRKAILTLAVRGQLCEQSEIDGPVDVLLAMNDDRRRQTAANDARADVEQQELLSAEDRWNIPVTWEWRGLADLVLFIDYRGRTPKKVDSGVRLVTAKNVRRGEVSLHPEEFITEAEYDEWMTRGFPVSGDVLFTTEAPMGFAAVVRLVERFALAQRVICFQSYGAVDGDFLVLQILSDQFQHMLDKNGTGVTAKGIKAAKLKRLPIAVPPLAEQRRIVAKVIDLMALVDRLEADLAAARTTGEKLMDAVVAELTTENCS